MIAELGVLILVLGFIGFIINEAILEPLGDWYSNRKHDRYLRKQFGIRKTRSLPRGSSIVIAANKILDKIQGTPRRSFYLGAMAVFGVLFLLGLVIG